MSYTLASFKNRYLISYINRNNCLWYFVWIVLLLSFFYTSYRYPFQINSSGTSPTYIDTPFFLKLGKYILFSILYLFASLVVLLKKNIIIRKPIFFVAHLFLTLIPLSYALLVKYLNVLEFGFFLLIPVFIHLFSTSRLNLLKFNKLISWVLIIAIFTNIIQVINFVIFDRLPALAYENSLIIRFGSFLDDPNGFGQLIAFFLGFSFYYYERLKKKLIILFLLISLILTQSVTAFISVPLSIVFFHIFSKWTWRKYLKTGFYTITVFAIAMAIVWYYWVPIKNFTLFFYNLKLLSIQGHLSGIKIPSSMELIGLSPGFHMSESGLLNILGNFGIAYLIIYCLIIVVCIKKCFVVINSYNKSNNLRAFYTGSVCFFCAVLIGSLNLPFEQVFPINALLFTLIGLVNSGVLDFQIVNQTTFHNRKGC